MNQSPSFGVPSVAEGSVFAAMNPRHDQTPLVPVCVPAPNGVPKAFRPADIPEPQTQSTYMAAAVLTTRATVLVLCSIRAADRPLNPSDFPPCVQTGLMFDETKKVMNEANGPRHALARIPRQWTVALRRPDSDQTDYKAIATLVSGRRKPPGRKAGGK